MSLTLDFGKHGRHDGIAVHVIKFSICNCKGNNLPCVRKSGHSLDMNRLFCDCNIPPVDEDNTYIGSNLKCDYIIINDIIDKTKEHIESFSFLAINTCFMHLYFSGCPRSIILRNTI